MKALEFGIGRFPPCRAYLSRSTVSTGKKGHETPTGVFSILQKREEHYSNLYNNAAMPYMQWLTWTGIALHAGQLPVYPASHGCIRLPVEFSKRLYGITQTGMTVVITSSRSEPRMSNKPYEVLAKSRPSDGKPRIQEDKAGSVFWEPERQREGSLAIIISITSNSTAPDLITTKTVFLS